MYESKHRRECVCSEGVSTPMPGAINSGELEMTPKLPAIQLA